LQEQQCIFNTPPYFLRTLYMKLLRRSLGDPSKILPGRPGYSPDFVRIIGEYSGGLIALMENWKSG